MAAVCLPLPTVIASRRAARARHQPIAMDMDVCGGDGSSTGSHFADMPDLSPPQNGSGAEDSIVKRKTVVISAKCPDCLKEFRKTRALKSFSKCSKVKDFVRIMDNTAKLAGMLLLKQRTTPLTEEEAKTLEIAQARLDDPKAQERYNQVLLQRETNKKVHKVVPKSLEERACLDIEIEIPPPRVVAAVKEEATE